MDSCNASYLDNNSCALASERGSQFEHQFLHPRLVRGARPLPELQHRQRQFPFRQIGPQRLARRRLRTKQIQAVIIHLVSRAQRQAEFPQRRLLRAGAPLNRAPRWHDKANNSAVFISSTLKYSASRN